MRKRLRKKKRVGEFTEYGFEIGGTWSVHGDGLIPAQDAFVDELIDFVEAHGLGVGGGANGDTFGFYVTGLRPVRGSHPRRWSSVSAREEDRATLETFLRQHATVATSLVGPLTDAWNGKEEDELEAAVPAPSETPLRGPSVPFEW